MIVFLDFEASSLSKKSFPIEVAWVFENGQSRSALIRPAPDWTDWSPEAEAIHGIPRRRLLDEGLSVGIIATEMIDALSGHKLYASAPCWDGKWLSALLRAAGYQRHALRLARSEEAFFDSARMAAGAKLTDAEISALVATILLKTEPVVLAHRALPDAVLELGRWRSIRAIGGVPTGKI
ncbi:transcriptional regulator [Rhizobium sp. P32RR-XVIII]|uniref:transcriptional regulator n=1 Tax=Rhizobium sp. P32RR-XVIII TaxID=2726738 RepID=UPI0014563E8A|nr:transcriptional regulator [Rhizobium sp. P32RR-XVIII]NLS07761.1 transcriptional regulator [Rhizobium sp. P32RR-XVIII]